MQNEQSIGIRQDEMTSGERLEALLAGKPIDRIPITNFGMREFSAINVGYTIAESYTDPEKSVYAQVCTMEQYGFQLEPNLAYASYGAWEFGGEVKMPSGDWEQAPYIKRYPVETEDDAEDICLPDVTRAGIIPVMMEFSKVAERQNLPILPFISPPFSTAGNICGLERLARWLYRAPHLVHHLLQLSTDHGVEVAKYWVDTFGAAKVSVRTAAAEESNQIISPRHFEEFVLPYEKQLHERILSLGIRRFFNCHICGDQNLNLPYWAQVPMGDLGLVSFDHDTDLEASIKFFGESCIVAGNLNTSLLQMGTPQEVYEAARSCIEKGKKAPRGFMLSPGCGLPPNTPPYNVYMMRKAIDDFGWYK
ncbi:MAG: uroporphyrinogen decarboxylase family protein [Deltaproteobacteria bacterium]|nr:uroporphyrinogen decarboxylase family protein [Deltaproteobacteria bacterium]